MRAWLVVSMVAGAAMAASGLAVATQSESPEPYRLESSSGWFPYQDVTIRVVPGQQILLIANGEQSTEVIADDGALLCRARPGDTCLWTPTSGRIQGVLVIDDAEQRAAYIQERATYPETWTTERQVRSAAYVIVSSADEHTGSVPLDFHGIYRESGTVEPGPLTVTWWLRYDDDHLEIRSMDGNVWCLLDRQAPVCTRTFNEPGLYEYRVRTDYDDGPGTDWRTKDIASIRVLRPAPEITMDLEAGSVVEGVITITGTVQDPAYVESVRLRFDPGYTLTATLDGSNWTATYDTRPHRIGDTMVTATVVATDGGTNSTSVQVTNANPPRVNLAPWGFYEIWTEDGTIGFPEDATNLSWLPRGPWETKFNARVYYTANVDFEVDIVGQYYWRDAWHEFDRATLTSTDYWLIGTTLTWDDPLMLGSYPVRMVIDPDNAIAETNEDDNERYTTSHRSLGAYQ